METNAILDRTKARKGRRRMGAMMVGLHELILLLGLFVAIDTSAVYPPEVRESFVENSLAGQTFTKQLPDSTVAVFMTGNFGVCKSKKGIVLPLSELASFAREVVSTTSRSSEDAAMLEGMHKIARSFLRMFHGEVGVALLNFPVGRRPPDFIIRADLDESEMPFTDMAKSAASVFGIAARSFVTEEDGYLIVGKRLHVRIKDGRLYASNSRAVLEQFLSGALKEKPLSESPLYREMGKRVEFDQEQFLFVNVERIWEEFLEAEREMSGQPNAVFSTLVRDIRAIATSTRLSEGNLNVVSSMLFKDLTRGIPRIIARPNARSQAATFVPPDYSLLLRAHTDSPRKLLQDVMRLHEEVAEGLRRALAEVDRKLGLRVEQDLLPALAGDFAVAAKMPPMVGIPESLAIVKIADYDKAVSALQHIFARAGLPRATPESENVGLEEEYKGATLRIVPLPLVSLTYVFVESHLLVGSSPEVVKHAIDAHLSGKSLAASEGYTSAFRGHPSESFGTVYADTETIFRGLLNIGGGLAMWKAGPEAAQFIVPLIGLLRRNARDLSPVCCTVYREGNAILLKSNSRLFAAGPAPLLLPGVLLARRTYVRRDMIRQREAVMREREKMMLERRNLDEPAPMPMRNR